MKKDGLIATVWPGLYRKMWNKMNKGKKTTGWEWEYVSNHTQTHTYKPLSWNICPLSWPPLLQLRSNKADYTVVRWMGRYSVWCVRMCLIFMLCSVTCDLGQRAEVVHSKITIVNAIPIELIVTLQTIELKLHFWKCYMFHTMTELRQLYI